MERNKKLEISYLFLIVSISVLTKWIVLFIFYENDLFTNILTSIQDKQYFPLIISISNLDFSPTYLDIVKSNKLISFPVYGIFFHSLFYKIFGVFSFIFLEYFFQLLFFYIFFITINKIFNNEKKTLLFCIFILFLLLILEILTIGTSFRFIDLIKTNLVENFGSRVPRPLLTGIFYFLFYFIIFRIIDNFKFDFNFKYFLFISFILSILLNSFFYYFINFSLLFIFLLIVYQKKKLLEFFKINLKNLILLILIFILFASPFLFQIIYGEPDYSNRIGLIEVDLERKLYLVKYYLKNLLRFEFLILNVLCITIYFYLNYVKKNDFELVKKTNVFFYFIIISMISPVIFFIISPLIVSIYHFLGILIFSSIFYLMINIFYLFINKIKFFYNQKNYYNLLNLLVIIYLVGNISVNNSNLKKISNSFSELNKIQNFIENEDLKNTNLKLFTNDLDVMNLWLFNRNTQLVISDGFTNSLKNSQIEYNLINSLKNFQISENDFKKIISFNKSELRNPLIMKLFIYRYQANSLHTFSEIDNYTDNYKKLIVKTSPFRAQFQIMPEDEKIRLIKMFKSHKVNEKFTSDYVILNNSLFSSSFDILNLNYKKIFSSESFIIYKKIKILN